MYNMIAILNIAAMLLIFSIVAIIILNSKL